MDQTYFKKAFSIFAYSPQFSGWSLSKIAGRAIKDPGDRVADALFTKDSCKLDLKHMMLTNESIL